MKTIVIGVIGADVHAVGNKIIEYVLKNEGYNVVNVGVLSSQEDFINAAVETNADLILELIPTIDNFERAIAQAEKSENTEIKKFMTGINLIYQGIIQAMLVVGMFTLAKNLYGDAVASTMGFLTLNFIQLIHMYSVRTNHSIFVSNPFNSYVYPLKCFTVYILSLHLSPPFSPVFLYCLILTLSPIFIFLNIFIILLLSRKFEAKSPNGRF